MRALVTGATGFTGGHLARALLQRGYDVRALVRSPQKDGGHEGEGIELSIGDITNPDDVQRAVEGCDVVYHIAALYREAKYSDDVYWAVNVEGTRNVMTAAERCGVKRVVHCSTVGVHGDVEPPADENSPFAPGDVYQQTKLAGERIVQDCIARGFPATVVRPSAIYGPHDTRFLKLFRTIRNRTFRMIGDGQTYFHMVYIDDLVDGFIRCGELASAAGQTYILAGPRYTTLHELVRSIAKVLQCRVPRGSIPLRPVMVAAALTELCCKPLGIEPPLHRRRVAFFCKHRAFDCRKAGCELGYQPRVDLDEGLAKTAEWYRSTNLLSCLGLAASGAAAAAVMSL